MTDELIKAFETIRDFCLKQDKVPCYKCPLRLCCYDNVIPSLCDFAAEAIEVLKDE